MNYFWSFQALGVFRAVVYGGETPREANLTTYAKKLVIFLISNGRSGLTKQEIAEQIWPLATSAQARNRLHVAIHDVRATTGKALVGGPELLEVSRSTVTFNSAISIHSDWHWLTTLGEQLNSLPDSDLHAAVFCSDFRCFPGESGVAWIDRINQVAFTLGNLVQHERIRRLVLASRFEDALKIAERAFFEVPTNEDLCKLLMQCYFKLGRREAALQAFDRLRRSVSDAYDMRVSEPLLNFAAQIRANTAAPHTREPALTTLKNEPIEFEKELVPPPRTLAQNLMQGESRLAGEGQPEKTEGTLPELFDLKAIYSLKLLLQTPRSIVVWLWGAPGSGKTFTADRVTTELVASGKRKTIRFSTFGLSTVQSILERAENLLQGARDQDDVQTILLIDIKYSADTDWASAVQELGLIAANAQILIVADFVLPQSMLRSVQVTNVQTLMPTAFDTGLSVAAEHFWRAAESYGFQGLVERSPAAQIEEICRFVGGNPSMIELAVNRLQHSPLSLLKDFLIAQAINESATHNNSLPVRLRGFLTRGIAQTLTADEHSLIALLRTVEAPISLFSVADLCSLTRLSAQEAVESLCNRGLIETIRSAEFDLVFVAMSGFNATVLGSLGLRPLAPDGLERIVDYFSRTEIINKVQNPQRYRQLQEIFRFELPWVEFALEYASKSNLRLPAIRLSKLLRRSYFDSGNLEAAAHFFTYALNAADNDKELADFYTVLGGLLERSGMTSLAGKRLLTGLVVAKRSSDDLRIATLRHSLGNVCISQGNLRRGEALLLGALDTYKKLEIMERCQLIAASLSVAYTNDLMLEKSRKVLEDFRPFNPSARTAGVQSWHLCSAYLAYFQGHSSALIEHLELTKLVGAHLDHAQLAYKAILLRTSICIANREYQEAIRLSVKGTRLMLASDFRADAVHSLSLEAMARIAVSDTYNAQIAIARAVSILPGVEDLEATGLLIFAGTALHYCSAFRLEEPSLRCVLHRKFESLPAYILAAFAKHPSLLRPFLADQRIDLIATKFESVKTASFFDFADVLWASPANSSGKATV
jgi:DNA-binding SARP family transcriptional activator